MDSDSPGWVVSKTASEEGNTATETVRGEGTSHQEQKPGSRNEFGKSKGPKEYLIQDRVAGGGIWVTGEFWGQQRPQWTEGAPVTMRRHSLG